MMTSMLSMAIIWYAGAASIRYYDADNADTLKAMSVGIYVGWAIMMAYNFAPDINSSVESTSRLFDIIDHKPIIFTPTSGQKIQIRGYVEFCEVSFRYPSRELNVLNNLSFAIQPGMFFSITGSSGSGKSTIMQLIIRLYDATSGRIFIDDCDISSYNITELRDRVLYVSQDPILFAGSIEDNLKLGREKTEEEVQDAIQHSLCTDFVQQYGLNRNVGTSGELLSGGQKQRLSIARALLRHPSLLLLDEATSSLDSNHEAELLSSLQQLTPSITIITVAHRPSSLQNSDVVAVMEMGSIVEIGSPNELLEMKGIYYNIISNVESG